MPKSRSLQSLLEATKKKNIARNPSAIITKDAESELSPLSIPDPEKIGEDLTTIVDAVGGKGTSEELVKKLPEKFQGLVKGLTGFGRGT